MPGSNRGVGRQLPIPTGPNFSQLWVKRRWPQLKKRKGPARADRVRSRIWGVIAALGAIDVRTQKARRPCCTIASIGNGSPRPALAYERDGSDAHLVFQLRPGAYQRRKPDEFLNELNEREQRSMPLICDGLPAHRSHRMSEWLLDQRSDYWSSCCRATHRLTKLFLSAIDEVADVKKNGFDRIGTDAPLCFTFLHHSSLRL